jgi:hypothetical protein
MNYQIFYHDKKGGNRMQAFGDAAKLWAFMDTLRIRAVVKSEGEIVGRIEHRTDGFYDQPGNRQWFGWLDTGAGVVKDGWEYVKESESAE